MESLTQESLVPALLVGVLHPETCLARSFAHILHTGSVVPLKILLV